jgi:hypothetical protein
MSFLYLVLYAGFLHCSSLAWGTVAVDCHSAPEPGETEVTEVHLVFTDRETAKGSAITYSWNGYQGKNIPFHFGNVEFKRKKIHDFATAEKALQLDPPRYLGIDGKFDINQESVAMIWISFKADPFLENSKTFKALVFFYQRYYLHDMFVDGGEYSYIRCTKRRN